MKKKFFSIFVILFIYGFLPITLFAEGIDSLSARTFNSIMDFFTDKFNVKISVVKFENISGFSDITAQKFYQLLVSKFESQKKIGFTDLMINFSKNSGEFNLTRIGNLNYLIYLKLIRNRDKLGIGTVIFSRSLDKIVYIKYAEDFLTPGETDIINTVDYGFKTAGFFMATELEADKNLLDFKNIDSPGEADRYFFYYPEKIEIYKMDGTDFKKSLSFKIKWGRPYYPVTQPEGKLTSFFIENTLYITVGSNFSPGSKIFELKDNQWRETGSVNFVPFKFIRLNTNEYLVGASYQEGKNVFENKLIFAPFRSGKLNTSEIYEKSLPLFYSITFADIDTTLDSIHIIDTGYRYRFFASDLEEKTVDSEKRGAAISALNGKWLAVSGYSQSVDKLYFYKIGMGSREPVFENSINGEIIFISDGAWKRKAGFWVYVKFTRERENADPGYRLQFWGENDG